MTTSSPSQAMMVPAVGPAPGPTLDADRDESTVDPTERASVLVVDAAEVRVGAVKRWMLRQAWVCPTFAASPAAAVEIAAREQPEIVLLDLLFCAGRGVALAIELGRLSPTTEVVLVVEDPGAPEVQVAFDSGCTRLVRADGLVNWLGKGLLPLARAVRAERQLALARRQAEELAAGDVRPSQSGLPLAVAERRYREAYLRSKLAQTGGRREAAALSGIPYTTFCVMLRKRGIAWGA
jgi:CheY-like chemotaxis protein